VPCSMQPAPGYRLSPFPTESLRWRCTLILRYRSKEVVDGHGVSWGLGAGRMVSRKGKKQMIPLLKLAIEAHGGLERWREVHGIDLKLTIGGGLWQLKGLPQGLVDVALHL